MEEEEKMIVELITVLNTFIFIIWIYAWTRSYLRGRRRNTRTRVIRRGMLFWIYLLILYSINAWIIATVFLPYLLEMERISYIFSNEELRVIIIVSLNLFTLYLAVKAIYSLSWRTIREPSFQQQLERSRAQESEAKEFKINEYLSVKFEHGRTNIYVKGRQFQQCKFLLLQVPQDQLKELSEINSIDEAAKLLDHSNENGDVTIPPEEEFWGHCSNLQAWYENLYDLRLLHSNLGFPLLKELMKAGDPLARISYCEELARKIERGTYETIITLFEKHDLDILTDEEIDSLDFSQLGEKFREFLKKKNKKEVE